MRRPARTLPALLSLALALALGSGCSSDEFGPLGGELPQDVVQDSVAVVVDPVVADEVERHVSPITQVFTDRQVMYLGNRALGGWRATPVMRFDFSGAPDSIDYVPSRVRSTVLQLRMKATDAGEGITHDVDVHALADTLQLSFADTSAADLLGNLVTQASEPGELSFDLALPTSVVLGWIADGAHTGVALYDRTAEPDSLPNNFVALASRRLTRRADFNIQSGETFAPEIVMEIALGDGPTDETVFLEFPVLEHFSIVEQVGYGAGQARLGAYLARRSWLHFSVPDSAVPGNATINRALLKLEVDPGTTLQEGRVTLAAFRVPRSEAGTITRGSADLIFRALGAVDLGGEELSLDVTDFVQRGVNGLLSPDDGILLILDDETYRLDQVGFLPASAPVDSLRPRLEITFTPPAEFW